MSINVCTQALADYRCRVLDHQTVGQGLNILTLQSLDGVLDNELDALACRVGQFVMLDLPVQEFYFRRPFSVLWSEIDGTFAIYYKIVGKGTVMMAALEKGEEINILGPLGTTFTMPASARNAMVIGGGIGIAPLYFMGQELQRQRNLGLRCYYGVRSESEIGLLEPLTEIFGAENLHISTDDGSYGFHGNVCQMLENENLDEIDRAYVCGPTVMMDAVVQFLRKRKPDIHIEASLEEHMPCGTGACTGCVVERADQPLPSKVCVEGPVFDAAKILWPSQKKVSIA